MSIKITPKKARELLGISRPTLIKYRDLGMIKGEQLPSGHWRYYLDSVNSFLGSPDKAIVDIISRCRI